jgi:hypothetical protein
MSKNSLRLLCYHHSLDLTITPTINHCHKPRHPLAMLASPLALVALGGRPATGVGFVAVA